MDRPDHVVLVDPDLPLGLLIVVRPESMSVPTCCFITREVTTAANTHTQGSIDRWSKDFLVYFVFLLIYARAGHISYLQKIGPYLYVLHVLHNNT